MPREAKSYAAYINPRANIWIPSTRPALGWSCLTGRFMLEGEALPMQAGRVDAQQRSRRVQNRHEELRHFLTVQKDACHAKSHFFMRVGLHRFRFCAHTIGTHGGAAHAPANTRFSPSPQTTSPPPHLLLLLFGRWDGHRVRVVWRVVAKGWCTSCGACVEEERRAMSG